MVAIPTPKSLSDGQRSLISYDEMEKVIATLSRELKASGNPLYSYETQGGKMLCPL